MFLPTDEPTARTVELVAWLETACLVDPPLSRRQRGYLMAVHRDGIADVDHLRRRR